MAKVNTAAALRCVRFLLTYYRSPLRSAPLVVFGIVVSPEIGDHLHERSLKDHYQQSHDAAYAVPAVEVVSDRFIGEVELRY